LIASVSLATGGTCELPLYGKTIETAQGVAMDEWRTLDSLSILPRGSHCRNLRGVIDAPTQCGRSGYLARTA